MISSKLKTMSKSWLLKLWSFYPPYLGAGVRIKRIAPDFSSIDVEMKLRFWNQNYVGTQFGGSLYSMTDPFFMIMLMHRLGPAYTVWDKAASIRFKSPGRGRVRARFEISTEQVDVIRAKIEQEGKFEPQFQVQVLSDDGKVVAEVDKTLWVKKKI